MVAVLARLVGLCDRLHRGWMCEELLIGACDLLLGEWEATNAREGRLVCP